MKKHFFLALFVVLVCSFTFVLPAEAKNCKKGKQCGNTCIAMSYTCHIGTYEATPSYTYPSTTYIPNTNPIPTILLVTGTATTGSSTVTTGIVDTGALHQAKLDAGIAVLVDMYTEKYSKKKTSFHKLRVKKYYKMYTIQTDEDKKYILSGFISWIAKTFGITNPIGK